MPRYLLTAALPYANGPIHIGHLAGCYLPADVYHRYLKAKGEDALLICGTDEHGVAITLQARKEGVTPQELVDRNFKVIHKRLKAWASCSLIFPELQGKFITERPKPFSLTCITKDF